MWSLFQLGGCARGRRWVSVADSLTSGLLTKRAMLYLNTFRLHALLNATQIVLYYESGPPQPTSNTSLLVDIKTTTTRRTHTHTHKSSSAALDIIDSERKQFLIFLQGIFSNSQVINSFSQIAYSISRTWIPNKVFGFMWQRVSQGVE